MTQSSLLQIRKFLAMYLFFCLCNIVLAIVYLFSSGPFVLLESTISSSRELASSGGDDWFGIVIALSSFVISLMVGVYAVGKPMRQATLKAVYAANYAVFAFLLYLVQLDTSLLDSIRYGDWPLALAVSIPTIGLITILVGALRLGPPSRLSS